MATKRDLVENLSKKLEYLSPEDTKCAVDCILNYIKDELANGNRVEIRGFGSMSVRKRKYADKDEYYIPILNHNKDISDRTRLL